MIIRFVGNAKVGYIRKLQEKTSEIFFRGDKCKVIHTDI